MKRPPTYPKWKTRRGVWPQRPPVQRRWVLIDELDEDDGDDLV